MTFTQAQTLANIDKTIWQGFDFRKVDPATVPFGGTVTLLNAKGDVMKVYADGSTQVITSEEFSALRT